MHCTARQVLRKMAKEGFNYMVDETKRYYPWLKHSKQDVEESVNKAKEEAVPALSDVSNRLSKLLMKKYEKVADAANVAKNAKKKQKELKRKGIRNTVVGTTIGFSAGIAAGYVLVKKSQIKESDYVFDDHQISLTANNENNNEDKTNKFEPYTDDYKIPESGKKEKDNK